SYLNPLWVNKENFLLQCCTILGDSYIVMADIGNAFTIRRLVLINGISWLNSDNSAARFDSYAFHPNKDMAIIGVVTFVIKAVR
ncbi:MAG: hypothetical protein J6572_11265, partial [Gilliamella sp.]|nr:hypothetical protein [Gilliamella sp.]